jgi:hypothetical protein
MNRFEQLIEYVINDEDAKARELFHDIVVAKSREIYENLMQEEAEEDLEEGAEEELDEDAEEELDESAEEELDEDAEEDLEEGMGGDASDDLIDNVEADESQDMSMEDAEEEIGGDADGDFGSDEGGSDEPATKDDILNLEDKLDQLMAEFEDLMGGDDMGDGDSFGPEEGGDAIEMDDTGEMMEAISLKAAPKPVTSEEGGVNKKSTVSANSGAKGPIGSTVKPVHAGGEGGGKHDAAGAYSNQTKDLIGKVGNSPAQGTQQPKPATKPHLAQATGVNTKSPVARG